VNINITGVISANQTSLETGEIARAIKSKYTPASTGGKYFFNKTAPFFYRIHTVIKLTHLRLTCYQEEACRSAHQE